MTRVALKSSGSVLHLGPAAELGRGTEGVVYRHGDAAVKVFGDVLDDATLAKLDTLIRFAPVVPGFAWPADTVHATAGGPAVGYLMPLATGRSLEALMDARETAAIPAGQKAAVSATIARAVAAAHAAPALNMCLGDALKAANTMIDDDTVVLVDAATVSLFRFRATNGSLIDAVSTLTTPGYVPPEMLANPHATPNRAADLFALAVVIFELIFGRPPTEPRPCAAAVGLDPDDAVRRGLFVRYIQDPDFTPPAYDPVAVPADIDDLFRSAFLGAAHRRPTAAEWVGRLSAWRDSLVPQGTLAAGRDRIARVAEFARRYDAVAAAIIAAVAIVFLGIWAVTELGAASRPSQTPPPKSAPAPVPSKPVGPALFQEIFK